MKHRWNEYEFSIPVDLFSNNREARRPLFIHKKQIRSTMKSIIKTTLILAFLISNTIILQAQVGINDDGSQPDASSLLDVKSTTKGILIPRMTTTQRTSISNPATGLMVFDNTTTSFWFYTGSAWTEIKAGSTTALQDADSDTKIQVEESTDEDKIRLDLGGSEKLVFEQNASGRMLIHFLNNNNNIFLGQGAGKNTSGQGNNFIGTGAGFSNTTGIVNNFIGAGAGYHNTTGGDNIFNGSYTGYKNTTGET